MNAGNQVSSHIISTTRKYAESLAKVERQLLKTASTIPPQELKDEVHDGFWTLMGEIETHASSLDVDEERTVMRTVRELLFRQLSRSRYFARSYLKPQGYAGDFMIIEWMYDLEVNAGNDPFQSAFANCLDYTFSTISSVVSLWERRRWLSQLVASELKARVPTGRPFQLLDVACGGSRYLADALDQIDDDDGSSPDISVCLFDQDPAALEYAVRENLRNHQERCRKICAPIKSFDDHFSENSFDMVISSGLFDYFDQASATTYLCKLAAATRPGGLIALTNYHVNDPSRIAKEWCADWSLILKDEAQLTSIFEAAGLQPSLKVSMNGSLLMAATRVR